MSNGVFLNPTDATEFQASKVFRRMQAMSPADTTALAHSADLVARALTVLDQDSMRSATRCRETNIEDKRPTTLSPVEPASAANLALQRRILSDGAECFLPIRYFDVLCLVATFLVSPSRAEGLLPDAGLQLVLQEDGQALVDLYCIEYRKTDIGPYNEVGLTVRATAPGDPIAANYVMNLPVTTAVANRAGREIWGYNKFVAAIEVRSEGKTFSSALREVDGDVIGALEGIRTDSVLTPATDILTFSLHNGRLIKTVIKVMTPSYLSIGDNFEFKIGASRHPMADNLRRLALHGARPVLISYADPFQALLFPGQPL
jgi:Acetoacetate decarboxylase (ADC)